LNEYHYSEVVPKIGNGWTYHWDDLSKVPYLTSTTQTKLISYDDSMSLRHKCEYVKQKNLRGLMIWALGQDLIGEDQILLSAVGTSMGLIANLSRDKVAIPGDHLLLSNYPNPFNNRTVISYTVPRNARVTLVIFTITGENVITLLDEFKSAGNYRFEWEPHTLVSGVYVGRLQCGPAMQTEKFILLK
jgi:chitinase